MIAADINSTLKSFLVCEIFVLGLLNCAVSNSCVVFQLISSLHDITGIPM